MERWLGKPRALIAGTPAVEARLWAILRGYERRAVCTMREAKQALEKHRFNLVLIDARFEESSVLDFLRWIRTQDPHLSVVCMDGYGDRSRLAEGAATSGADLVIDLQEFSDDHRGDRRIRRILDELLETSSYRRSAAAAVVSSPRGVIDQR
jgi:CheY-like chemotaxis protein